MIYYLTYNEPLNGIFNSQVLDVVKYLRLEHKVNIKLISFLPIGFNMSNFRDVSAKLKSVESNCVIIPTLPVQYGWKFNWLLLYVVLLFHKKGSIFSREIFASYLALKCRNFGVVKKVCHDGRGSNLGQMLEYDVYPNNLKKDVENIEPYVINQADFRLAVSNNLITYWQKHFLYQSNQHVVIPCTISERNINHYLNEKNISNKRKEFGFLEKDVVLVFSGSNFGWQSFDLIKQFCELQLMNDERVKIVFLSKEDDVIKELIEKYKDRILCKWLTFEEVSDFLIICDYGILLRLSNDTNNVASPTKFGEYLASGLPVIVSGNLEFSKLVSLNHCGILVNNESLKTIHFNRITFQEKERIIDVAKHFFLKSSSINQESYNQIISKLN